MCWIWEPTGWWGSDSRQLFEDVQKGSRTINQDGGRGSRGLIFKGGCVTAGCILLGKTMQGGRADVRRGELGPLEVTAWAASVHLGLEPDGAIGRPVRGHSVLLDFVLLEGLSSLCWCSEELHISR